MAEKNGGGSDDLALPVPGGDRKLSIPNSVQRRKWGSMGTYDRVIVCAVDPSDIAKSAFFCTC